MWSPSGCSHVQHWPCPCWGTEAVQPGQRGHAVPVSSIRCVKYHCHFHPRAEGTAVSKMKERIFSGEAQRRGVLSVFPWWWWWAESLGQDLGLCTLLWFWILPLSFAFSALLWALTFCFPGHFISGENAHVVVPLCISICQCSWCFPKLDMLQ